MVLIGYTEGTKFWGRFYQSLCSFFTPTATAQLNPSRCDIFVCTYWDCDQANRYPNALVVFISGEPKPITFHGAHLIIDCKHINIPFFYYPFYAFSFFERTKYNPSHLLKSMTIEGALQCLKRKSKFCAYMYRYDVDFRVRMYDTLNNYKPVDALGISRNRNPRPNTDRGSSNFM